MMWKEIEIENVCSKVTSGGTPLRSQTDFYDGGNIAWVKTKEVNFNRIYETEEHIREIYEITSAFR